VVSTTAVFRIPLFALVAVGLLVLCMTPVALGGSPWLAFLYLVPLALAVWLIRERTTVDASGVVVRYVLATRRLPWHELNGLLVGNSGAVRAVTASGEAVRLPGVRVRDLPRLAQVSGGALDLGEPRQVDHAHDAE
jgi:Bacterial PH domain